MANQPGSIVQYEFLTQNFTIYGNMDNASDHTCTPQDQSNIFLQERDIEYNSKKVEKPENIPSEHKLKPTGFCAPVQSSLHYSSQSLVPTDYNPYLNSYQVSYYNNIPQEYLHYYLSSYPNNNMFSSVIDFGDNNHCNFHAYNSNMCFTDYSKLEAHQYNYYSYPSPNFGKYFLENISLKQDFGEHYISYPCSGPAFDNNFLENVSSKSEFREHYVSYPYGQQDCNKNFLENISSKQELKEDDIPYPYSRLDLDKNFSENVSSKDQLGEHFIPYSYSRPDFYNYFSENVSSKQQFGEHFIPYPYCRAHFYNNFSENISPNQEFKEHYFPYPCGRPDFDNNFSENISPKEELKEDVIPYPCDRPDKNILENVSLKRVFKKRVGNEPLQQREKRHSRSEYLENQTEEKKTENKLTYNNQDKKIKEKVSSALRTKAYTFRTQYTCAYCGRKYTKRKSLENHTKLHTDLYTGEKRR